MQELAVPSAHVLFEWRSLDHVKLTESYSKVAPAFDFFHVNSIDVDADGNLLVSARNTWTVYKIDRTTGKVIWRLGGKKSDFAMGPGTKFAWQHDARHVGDGSVMTLFDNADDPQVEPQSRGLTLSLDLAKKRATLLHQYVHRPKLLAHAFGSVQTQPNGNVLVGWATEPYYTEYTASGAVLLDAKLPYGGQNYRTLRFPWSSIPAEPPRLAARPTPSGTLLYATWNGATGVQAWQVLAGPKPTSLTLAEHGETNRIRDQAPPLARSSVRGSCRAGRRREAARPFGSRGPVGTQENLVRYVEQTTDRSPKISAIALAGAGDTSGEENRETSASNGGGAGRAHFCDAGHCGELSGIAG